MEAHDFIDSPEFSDNLLITMHVCGCVFQQATPLHKKKDNFKKLMYLFIYAYMHTKGLDLKTYLTHYDFTALGFIFQN